MSGKEKVAVAHRGGGASARRWERFGTALFIDGEERAEAGSEST
jgi:hypothetical protein